MSERDDPFYVGFLKAPSVYRRAIVGFVLIIAVLVALDAYVIAQIQAKPSGGAWGDDVVTLEGVLDIDPYPVLRMAGLSGAAKSVLLVGEGKVGAEAYLAGITSGAVQLHGTMIERDGRMMLEIVAPAEPMPETMAAGLGEKLNRPPAEDLGAVSLKGEIVDPKCWFGVMRPSDGVVHKGCATLCLTGGIPPVLVTQSAAGQTTAYLLVDQNNEPIGEALLSVVAVPVAVDGRLERRGDLFVLKIDAAKVRLL